MLWGWRRGHRFLPLHRLRPADRIPTRERRNSRTPDLQPLRIGHLAPGL